MSISPKKATTIGGALAGLALLGGLAVTGVANAGPATHSHSVVQSVSGANKSGAVDTPEAGDTPDSAAVDTPEPGDTADAKSGVVDTPEPGDTPDAKSSVVDTPEPGDTPDTGASSAG